MKLLTFAIPSYNSQDYMEHCILSLLPGGDDVEILIVDDGSKDRTAEIADEYERKYPGIVRAIPSGKWRARRGSECRIRNATGLFFKVVDSDDWVDYEAYMKILKNCVNLLVEIPCWICSLQIMFMKKRVYGTKNHALFFPAAG